MGKPMRILLTGGCGDLGKVLAPRLANRGDDAILLDVTKPNYDLPGTFIEGSVLERDQLPKWFSGCEIVVHIAAWHGIHEFRKEKDAYDFFDLNIRGTFEVFEASVRAGVRGLVLISSTSIDEPNTVYGNSKLIAEQIASFYASHHAMPTITLRPRAFIPHWNRVVYNDYIEWARWFWKGAVHIDDVAQAIEKSIDFLSFAKNPGTQNNNVRDAVDTKYGGVKTVRTENLILTVDGAYEYSDEEFENWDCNGPGTTFKSHFPEYSKLAIEHGLPIEQRPRKLDISRTTYSIGYEPRYSVRNLLEELSAFGAAGPSRKFDTAKFKK